MSRTRKTRKHASSSPAARPGPSRRAGPLQHASVAILVEDHYQEMELWVPYYRLLEAGAQVLRVGTGRKEKYASKLGYECPEDLDVHAARVEDFNGVIIPGGYAPDLLRRYDAVNTFVREAVMKNKVVAAICHGPWVLVSADALKGRTATCYFSIRHDVANAGAEYVDRDVVVDRNLITSRTPDDLPAFLGAVIAALA